MEIHGGSALPNGVTFYSEHTTVTTIRNKRNEVITFTQQRKGVKIRKGLQVPLLRGLVFLLNEMFTGWKSSIFYLAFYGTMLYSSITNTSIEVVSSTPFLVGMLTTLVILFCYMYFFTAIFKYHAAEHMVGNAYDNDMQLTVANVYKQSRVHRYCGTNMVIFVLLAFVIIQFLDLPLIVAYLVSFIIGYEIFVMENNLTVKLFKPFYFVGSLLQQNLLTKPPSGEQIEVAITAVKELNAAEE